MTDKLEHEGTIYAVLKKYGLYNSRDEYIDICWIGYTKAINNFDKAKGTLRTYIYKCVENELLMELRKESRKKRQREEFSIDVENYSEVIPDEVDIETDTIKKETNEQLYVAISKLSDAEQMIINNSFNLGDNKITQQELAEQLNITQSQVSTIKDKALKKLKEIMEA